jgi:hypothetical protein
MGKWALIGLNKCGIRKVVYDVANWIVEKFQKDHFAKSIEPDEGHREILK